MGCKREQLDGTESAAGEDPVKRMADTVEAAQDRILDLEAQVDKLQRRISELES